MAKIAISLSEEVLQAVEKERLANGQSRSEFFRRAAEEYLSRIKQREQVEQYIKGYQKYPETNDERALAESTFHHSFDDDGDRKYWEEEFRK